MDKEEHREATKRGIEQAKQEETFIGRPPTGYELNENKQLIPTEPEYSRVTSFIQEVNRGRPKGSTARHFGIPPGSAWKILANSDRYWGAEYVGDEEWERRRHQVKYGERELEPLDE